MQCKPIALYKWTNYSFSHPLSPYELSIHNNATKKLLTNCFWNFLDTGGIGSIWPLFPQRHLCPCLCGPPAACTPCIMHHASFHHLKPMSILASFEVFLVSKQSPFFFSSLLALPNYKTYSSSLLVTWKRQARGCLGY